MGDSGRQTTDWDMKMRLAADRVLRAMAVVSPQRQAKLVMWASAALSVAAVVRPDALPPDLIKLKELLNVGAISGLLARVAADGDALTDEAIAAEMEKLLPVAQLDELATGQKDLLRVLTRQHGWQQRMLRLQEADAAAAVQLLAGMDGMGVDLVEIREALAGVATRAQVEEFTQLVKEQVIPRLEPGIRAKYLVVGGIFAGGDVHIGPKHVYGDEVHGDKNINIEWQPLPPYEPPAPPTPGELPAPGSLPPGHHILFDRNAFFTGRSEEMLALAEQLLPPTTNDQRRTQSVRHSSLSPPASAGWARRNWPSSLPIATAASSTACIGSAPRTPTRWARPWPNAGGGCACTPPSATCRRPIR